MKARLGEKRWIGWTLFILLGLIYGIVLALRVDTTLIYQYAKPVFLSGWSFARTFFNYPGGPADYAAAFLLQYFDVLGFGVGVLMAAGVLMMGLTRRLSAVTGAPLGWRGAAIPAILLLSLHSQYDYPLGATVGLLIALTAVLVDAKWLSKLNLVLRWTSFAALGFTVYVVTGGSFLFFALMCALFELLRRRWLSGIVMLLYGGLVPWISMQTLFLVSRKAAYFHPLSVSLINTSLPLLQILLAFFPLSLIWQSLNQNGVFDPLKKPFHGLGWIAKPAVLFVFLSAVALFSVNPYTKSILAVRASGRIHQWDNLLKEVRGLPIRNPHLTCLTSRALFHTGFLLDDLFAYPKNDGLYDLLLRTKTSFQDPLEASDLFWDLGYVNEAEHWAYEALVIEGQTPWVLKRLAELNLVKGERERAAKFILELDRTRYASWTKRFKKMLENPTGIRLDWDLQTIRESMVDKDFFYYIEHKKTDLEHLIEKNPKNKMAFEYWIAASLIDKQTADVAAKIGRFAELGYPSLPRHVQEAVLLYVSMTGKKDLDLSGYRISKSVMLRFNQLNQILAKHGGNKKTAADELSQSIGDTYWYHVMMANPADQQS
jgi:hypothetical protein